MGRSWAAPVADQLGVPFLDRAIPTAVAQTLAVTLDEAQAHDERADTRVGRMLSALAASGLGFGPTPEPNVPPQAYREQTERVITSAAQSTGCVVLGRAAVIVLRDHPSALHTCLNGPQDRRIAQAISLSSDDDDEAAVRKLVDRDRPEPQGVLPPLLQRRSRRRRAVPHDPRLDRARPRHVRRAHRDGSSSTERELVTSAGVSIGPESKSTACSSSSSATRAGNHRSTPSAPNATIAAPTTTATCIPDTKLDCAAAIT